MATITAQLQRVLSGRDSDRVSIIIEAEPSKGPQASDALRSRGISHEEINVRNKTVFEATVSRETLQQLAEEPSIAVLDHNPTFSPLSIAPNDPKTEVTKADDYRDIPLGETMEQLGVPEVWDRHGVKGEGVTIGMIDSPVDERHETFDTDIQQGLNATPEQHGTWVASALVGSEYEASGGTVHGGCPNADLVSYGALSGGGASVGEIAEGVSYCIEQEVDILNASFGGGHSKVLQNVMEEATDEGIAVVSSAGNSGPAPGTASCPAHHADLTAIGSVNSQGEPGAFSGRGPGWRGAEKPDAVAFGGHTAAKGGTQVAKEGIIGAAPNNQSVALIGTSMAAPQAASILGLRLSRERRSP